MSHRSAPLPCSLLIVACCAVLAAGCTQPRCENSQPRMAESRVNPKGCAQDARNNAVSTEQSVVPYEGVADPDFLQQFAETYRFRLGQPSRATFLKDGSRLLFLRSGPRSFVNELFELDLQTGAERVLVTAEALVGGGEETLSAQEKARRERMRLATRGIVSFALSPDETRLLFPLSGHLFGYSLADAAVVELPNDGGDPIDPQFSPDGTQVACVRNGDVYVIDLPSLAQRQLTHKANEAETNGLAEFVAQEEMGRYQGYWWSPDSQTIAYQHNDESAVETLYVSDPAHPEVAPVPNRYPRAGSVNVDVKVGLIAANGVDATTTWVEWDRTAYPYLHTVKWEKSAPLSLVVQNRTQTEAAILLVEPSGVSHVIHQERDEAWVNLEQDVPKWLDDGRFLWTTERDGFNQLELRAQDGALVETLTPASLGLRGLVAVDDDGGAWVRGGAEPTEEHLFRVPIAAPNDTVQLSQGEGLHSATVGPNGIWLHRTAELAGLHYQIESLSGGAALPLIQVSESPSFELNVAIETVNLPNAYRAALIRPRNFDPALRYPVLLSVYGGPHYRTVYKDRAAFYMDQWVADHGFIVVTVDGRGTPYRGRDWERAIKYDFVTVVLDDQVAALQALGAVHPELDLQRVGVSGWSFGGYLTAMAVIRRPEVFLAGVAGAPVVDWRDYDTHYTERYLGLPEEHPEAYDVSSVLTYAAHLERPLLLVHGSADDNVFFLHSLKLLEALFAARRPFEFLPLIGQTHMVRDPETRAHLEARTLEFFREKLGVPMP